MRAHAPDSFCGNELMWEIAMKSTTMRAPAPALDPECDFRGTNPPRFALGINGRRPRALPAATVVHILAERSQGGQSNQWFGFIAPLFSAKFEGRAALRGEAHKGIAPGTASARRAAARKRRDGQKNKSLLFSLHFREFERPIRALHPAAISQRARSNPY